MVLNVTESLHGIRRSSATSRTSPPACLGCVFRGLGPRPTAPPYGPAESRCGEQRRCGQRDEQPHPGVVPARTTVPAGRGGLGLPELALDVGGPVDRRRRRGRSRSARGCRSRRPCSPAHRSRGHGRRFEANPAGTAEIHLGPGVQVVSAVDVLVLTDSLRPEETDGDARGDPQRASHDGHRRGELLAVADSSSGGVGEEGHQVVRAVAGRAPQGVAEAAVLPEPALEAHRPLELPAGPSGHVTGELGDLVGQVAGSSVYGVKIDSGVGSASRRCCERGGHLEGGQGVLQPGRTLAVDRADEVERARVVAPVARCVDRRDGVRRREPGGLEGIGDVDLVVDRLPGHPGLQPRRAGEHALCPLLRGDLSVRRLPRDPVEGRAPRPAGTTVGVVRGDPDQVDVAAPDQVPPQVHHRVADADRVAAAFSARAAAGQQRGVEGGDHERGHDSEPRGGEPDATRRRADRRAADDAARVVEDGVATRHPASPAHQATSLLARQQGEEATAPTTNTHQGTPPSRIETGAV